MAPKSPAGEQLQVDELTFRVTRSPRRRTMQITVDRGGELLMTAPPGASHGVMSEFVREKRFWIYTKLASKEALQRTVPVKEFVNGEGFPYLGRSYRLLLVDSDGPPLKLEAGRFRLRRAEVAKGRAHFIRWYSEHGRVWLRRRAKDWAARMGVAPTDLDVRDLGYKWGSCTPSGSLHFHWATVLLPPPVVDYVIVHELAHLQHPDHSASFWAVVARTMPEYEQRKQWLAAHGAGVLVV